MRIRLEQREAFSVAGYAVETDASTNERDIGALWAQRKEALLARPEARSGLYGVMWTTREHRYVYLLGIESEDVDALGEGATRADIPAARFAVATMDKAEDVVEAWAGFFIKALPAQGYAPDAEHGVYFELCDENGAYELWTPCKPQKEDAK